MGWIALFSFLFGSVTLAMVGQYRGWPENVTGGWAIVVGLLTMTTALVLANPSEPAKPLTPAELRQQRIESQFSAWDGSQRQLVERVKSTMHDPGSFEHVETRFYDRGDQVFVHMKFRGANAFGGKVLTEVTADTNLDGKLLSVKMIEP